MPILSIFLFTALFQEQDKAVYKDTRLGLQFEHPKAWKIRRDRYSAVFEIPMAKGPVATVQVYNAKYKGPAEEWQLIQQEINRSLKRTVDRQWQEEYLGVPMLLTKLSYEDLGKPCVAIVGLLYSAYEEKLHFRLTSLAEAAEQAETSWRDAMLTLRTVSGELPTVENPNLPSVKPEPEKATSVWRAPESNTKPEKGAVRATLTLETTKFALSLPKGWELDGRALKNASIAGNLQVTAVVGLPEEAGTRLMESAKSAMAEFQSVDLRVDPKPLVARSGAVVGQVFRVGKSASGALVLGTGVGYCEGIYWQVDYRTQDPNAYKKDRRLLDELFGLLYAEKE